MRRVAVVFLCVVVAGCTTGPDQGAVVEAIGNQAIIPNLDAAVAGFEELDAAVTGFCNDPTDESHVAAQTAWVEARRSWEPAQPNTYFDPGDMLRTVSKVDYFPSSPEGIDRLLESETVIDTNYVDTSAASTQRGLGAIEHLLFRGIDAASAERSCLLIEGATAVAWAQTRELRDTWTELYDGLAPFIDQFTGEMTNREALSDVVSAIVETLKQQTLFQIGKSTGISSPSPVPGSMEEGAAGEGAATYLAQLEGIASWIEAGGETSLIELIRSRNDEVAAEIETRLSNAMSQLSAIDGPIEQIAVAERERLVSLYEELDTLRAIFESDVVSLLDLTLGFSDSDGDSG